jgi:hypothetical protein
MSAAPHLVPIRRTAASIRRGAMESREREAQDKLSVDRDCGILDRLERRETAYKLLIAELKRRIDLVCRTAERIEERNLARMQAAGARQLLGNVRTLSLRENAPKLEVDDQAAIPADYIRTKVTTEPDKLQIKAALARGEDVAGVHLVQTVSLIRK